MYIYNILITHITYTSRVIFMSNNLDFQRLPRLRFSFFSIVLWFLFLSKFHVRFLLFGSMVMYFLFLHLPEISDHLPNGAGGASLPDSHTEWLGRLAKPHLIKQFRLNTVCFKQLPGSNIMYAYNFLLTFEFWKTWSCHLVLVWESIFSIEPWSFWKTVHSKSEGGKDSLSKSLDDYSTNLVIVDMRKTTTLGDGCIWILLFLSPMKPEVTYPPKKNVWEVENAITYPNASQTTEKYLLIICDVGC